ncbi:hypothetical protein ACFL2Q_15410, partial [Thermodesulfobacteriota bacterium]
PVNWRSIAKGQILRFSGEGSVEESLKIDLKGAKYRYLRLRIANGDDPPLEFTGAEVQRYAQHVEFPARPSNKYALLLGYPKARAPEYDVKHYIKRLRKSGVLKARLGSVIPSPLHRIKTKKIPWSERNKGIIWIALLLMTAVLAFLIYRVAGNPGKEPPEA